MVQNVHRVKGLRPFFRPTPLAGILLGVFAVLAILVVIQPAWFLSAEESIARWVETIRTPTLTTFFDAVTQLGSRMLVTLVTVFATVALIASKRYLDGLYVLLTVALTAIFTQLFKFLLANPRPDVVHQIADSVGYAFPSGHTTAAFALIGSLAFVFGAMVSSRSVRIVIYIVAGVLIFLVGISRIYLGVHWTNDVLGGWLFGGAMLYTLTDTLKRAKTASMAGTLAGYTGSTTATKVGE